MKILSMILVAALSGSFVSDARSGETGCIYGAVVDAADGSPLRYATVNVVGTGMEGVARFNGTFMIRRVPAGACTLDVRMMGYRPIEGAVVRVSPAGATIIQFELEEMIVGRTREIIVEAPWIRVKIDMNIPGRRFGPTNRLEAPPADDVVDVMEEEAIDPTGPRDDVPGGGCPPGEIDCSTLPGDEIFLVEIDSECEETEKDSLAPSHVAISLAQNFPNPFNPSTRIEFRLEESAPVSLGIYDLAGRLVRELVSAALPAGRYEETWDGLRGDGSKAAAGVYFCRLASGASTRTRKMVLLR